MDFVRAGAGHGVIRATAGSGKTTTLVQIAQQLPGDLRVCFLAFGRDAVAELEQRLPASVAAMTVHKLGRRTLARHLQTRGVRLRDVDETKYRALARQELQAVIADGELKSPRGADGDASGPVPSEATLADCEDYLVDLARFARLNVTDTKHAASVRQLADRYGLVPPADPRAADAAHRRLRRVLKQGCEQALHGLIDFTDMLYVPYVMQMAPERYDFVCVDEAQDYSALDLSFTMRLVGGHGRLLFVGDPRQSIFGFAGADTDALDRIIGETGATVLPLSVTYRCPKSHVALARKIAPEIQARPDAPEGIVRWIPDRDLERHAESGDLIVCRTNAPLIGACLRLVRAGRRAFVLGRDVGDKLLDVARRALPDGFAGFEKKIASYAAAEEARLRQALGGKRRLESVLAQRRDLYACLAFLIGELDSSATAPAPSGTTAGMTALEALVARTFRADDRAVVLSTVHRAKGREAARVFILHPETMPAGHAETVEAVRGEECVQFVALTRARHELVFVASPPATKGKGQRG